MRFTNFVIYQGFIGKYTIQKVVDSPFTVPLLTRQRELIVSGYGYLSVWTLDPITYISDERSIVYTADPVLAEWLA